MLKYAAIVISVYLFVLPFAMATTRFVAPTGSDTTNNCTVSSTPCQTFAHAISVSVAGDTISAGLGLYAEHDLVLSANITLKGSASGPTIIDGGAAGRVLNVNTGVISTIYGKAEHAVILTNVSFANNYADKGGAVNATV